MNKNEQPGDAFEEYKEIRQWAKQIAKERGISLDEREEHFMIPVLDSEGKEIRKEFLSIQKNIPVNYGKSVNGEPSSVPLEDAIEAIKRYPDMRLADAVKKIKEKK